MTIHVDEVRTASAFDALEHAWRKLEIESRQASIFLGWDWQRLWWTQYGQGRELRVLVAYRDSVVAGIFPLYEEVYQTAGGLLKPRKLRQIGVGGDTAPDDLGALLAPEGETETAFALIEYVVRAMEDWDMIDWTDLSKDGPLIGAIDQLFPKSSVRSERRLSDPITYGVLPGDWDTYLKSLSKNRRETTRRKRRKFEAQPGATVRVVDDPEALDAAFERLAELHRKRWTGRTEVPGFSTDAYRGFHRSVMHALLPQGRLRLMALETDGATFGMLYGLKHRGTFFFFQAGFDPDYSALSPGDVLLGYAVEHAINDGCSVFDMLKGDHDYKRHFFQENRQNLEIQAFRPGLIDWAYRLKARFAPRKLQSHGQ